MLFSPHFLTSIDAFSGRQYHAGSGDLPLQHRSLSRQGKGHFSHSGAASFVGLALQDDEKFLQVATSLAPTSPA
jgi:hypothetical protein